MTDLSRTLSEARKKSGMSILEVSEITKIRPSYIDDLEKGRLNALPQPVYVTGFLRNLGRTYGIDSDLLVQSYRVALAGPREEETESVPSAEEPDRKERKKTEPPVREPGKAPETPAGAGRLPGGNRRVLQGMARRSQHRKLGKGLLAVLLLIGFVLLFVYGLDFFRGSGEAPPENPPMEDPVVPEDPAEELPPPAETPEEPESPGDAFEPQEYRYITPEPVEGGLDVMITVKTDKEHKCWINVMVDGQQIFRDTLISGETIRFYGQEEIRVTIGNLGALEIYEDGQPSEITGSEGQVLQHVFTRQ